MTDWLRQTEAGVDRWLQAQREWWDALLKAGPGGDPSSGAVADLQKRTVDAWREAAYKIIDAQAEMLLGAVREQSKTDAETLIRKWTDAQREMWQGWLAVAGQGGQAAAAAAPGGMPTPQDLTAAGKQMVDALRQAAERLVTSQAEWAKAWTEAQQGGSGGGDDTPGPAERGGP
jgi:hypothetical protein